MPPCAPRASSGEMNASSPPSTAKPAGGSASSATVSASIAADGVLDADHARQVRQPPQGVRRQVLPGAVRDVVDDERHRAGRGELGEVGEHARLARAHERRHQAQRRHHLWPVAAAPRSASAGAGADQQLRASVPGRPARRHRPRPAAPAASQRAGSAVVPSATRPRRAGVQHLVREGFQRVEGHRPRPRRTG